MFKFLTTRLNPTPIEQAKKDLRRAKITLLEAQALADYYKGLSISLKATIKRLEDLPEMSLITELE